MTMKRLVSSQAMDAYQTLSRHDKPLTAEQIASELSVMPNAIYRTMKQLLEVGVVTKSKSYPVTFKALSPAEALPWYILNSQKAFRESFGQPTKNWKRSNNKPTLTIVKDRDDFLRKTTQDALQAADEVNLIVSGLEVPDETILAYRKIIARGVKVRAIIQTQHETSKKRLEDWQGIRVEVRHSTYLGIRLFVVDDRNTYLVSYSKDNSEQALGVRYNYPPLAASMNDFFEQKWKIAKPVALL